MINGYLRYGDIYIDGCINPELIRKLNLDFHDNQNLNFKISGKSDGRSEFPDSLKEDPDPESDSLKEDPDPESDSDSESEGGDREIDQREPKQNLTRSEIQGIDQEILRQYYANDVSIVFTNEEYYKNHGLLFKIKCKGLNNFFNVRLSLLTSEEKQGEFSGEKSMSITDRVIPVLKMLNERTCNDKTPNGHEFLVFFDECRVEDSELNREISKKTDKSIECWLKWNRELIISKYGEDFYKHLSEYLKKKFSSMNEIYDFLENYKDKFLHFLNKYSKDVIIEYILLACFLSMVSNDLNDLMKQIVEKAPVILSIKDSKERTPLFHAVLSGNKEIVELLINKGEKFIIKEKDNEGRTPLFHAVFSGNKEIIELLISKGAKLNIADNEGRTILFNTVFNGNNEIVELLINKGARLNKADKVGFTPFLMAIISENKEIIELLISKGVDINIVAENEGRTPLIHSVFSGNKEIVELLISRGAEIDLADSEGFTPLIHAILKENEEIIELLISRGAEIDLADSEGKTPLIYAVLKENKEIIELLISGGAKIDLADSEGKTPLIHAIIGEDEEIVELLIIKNVDVHLQDKDGKDPQSYAEETNNPEIIEIIEDHLNDIE